MNGERKANWKCHLCKPRTKSASNNVYEVVFHEDRTQQKQQRENGEDDSEHNKRFKDSISLNELQSNICTVKSEITNVKTDVNEVRSEINDVKENIKELKASVEQLSLNVSNSDLSYKNEMKNSLAQITATLSDLVKQLVEMRGESNENKKEIKEMDTKLNKMQQQMLSKKIEIKNVHNKEIQANEVVKTIAASINVNINENDISDAYRLKNIKDKIIVEFTTHNKKREFMQHIKRHRINSNLINLADGNHNFIYLNDCLTAHNRKLLWLAKTKAKETNWKFVWSRNGSIFARKTENTPAILIKNAADIELII